MFENSHFYEHVPKSYMFVSLQDAVTQAQYEQQNIPVISSAETVPSKIMVCLTRYLFHFFFVFSVKPKFKMEG